MILVCNKADSEKRRLGSAEFTKLGFSDVVEVSAVHGFGIKDLVDIVAERLELTQQDEATEEAVREAKTGGLEEHLDEARMQSRYGQRAEAQDAERKANTELMMQRMKA